ncbi:MAG TPA: AAA family ATPase [Gammaproteobacteria bacterium]|nr:AAA family ATPase [Gammaproteobacteria bacterium]
MYQEFYKFSGKPFQLTPDVRFLFPSTGHKRALSYLLYGLEQREGFVVITGDVGTGKTLLIQALYKELAGRHMLTANIASANLDAPDVIPAVAAAFGQNIQGRGKVSLLEDLKRDLLLSCQQGEGALLIVDEAQTLTPAALEELRVLSNMEVAGRALVQIFLVGQTELLSTVRSGRMEQLKQRVIAWYKLEPLSSEETRNYIIYRLRAVGWRNAPGLAPDVFDLVHEWSRGVPRRINMLMDRAMLYGYLEELHFLDRGSIRSVIDEMNDEMGGEPGAAESQAVPPAPIETPTPMPAPATSEVRMRPIEEQIEALDRKLNFLLKSMNRRIVPGPGNRSNGVSNPADAGEQSAEEFVQYRQSQEGGL